MAVCFGFLEAPSTDGVPSHNFEVFRAPVAHRRLSCLVHHVFMLELPLFPRTVDCDDVGSKKVCTSPDVHVRL